MKKLSLPAAVLSAAFLFAGAAGYSAVAQAPLKVLIIDGQNNHKWEQTTPVLRHALEVGGRFRTEVSTTPPKNAVAEAWDAWRPDFAKFDVVLSNYNGQDWPAEVRRNFEEYVSGGGGFVCIHAADNSFPGWHEYNRMIGVGGWGGRTEKSGPWLFIEKGKIKRDTNPGKGGSHGAQREFVVETLDPEHPITKGLPAKWMHAKDELYSNLRGPAENVQVLAYAHSLKTGRNEPMLMAIPYGKGRVFHSTLGHADYSMRCVGFYTTLQRGAEWAATGRVARTANIPKRFPGPDAVSEVSAAAVEKGAARRAQQTERAGQPAAAGNLGDAEKRIYKTVGEVELPLYIYRPGNGKPGEKRPAIVFYFGGGWRAGSPTQFVEHCRYLASRGMVAITVEYRVNSKHDVNIEDCVEDAKSAMRWVRANAEELGVDPDRIASGGGSAGGHLGAVVGLIEGMDAEGEDTSVSAMSNAMVLFNPVMALASRDDLSEPYNTKMDSLVERIGVDPKAISPIEHIAANQPPMIMFFGTADGLKEGADLFQKETKKADNRCEMKLYDGMPHGFFNFTRYDGEYYRKTTREMDVFLASIGYLEGEPTIAE